MVERRRPAAPGAGPAGEGAPGKRSLYLASSGEAGIAVEVQRLADVLAKQAPPGLQWHQEKMPAETHGTIYHPAALTAFRAVFKPAAAPQ